MPRPRPAPSSPRGLARRALLAALALLALLACAAAQAQEWRYRVRPGDTLWDLGRAHLRADVPWERLQAHNGIDDPLALPPGSVLRFPVDWLRVRPAPATVLALQGEASVHPAGAAHRAGPLQAGARVHAGSVVRTAADASLTLGFADGSRILLHGDGELRLDRLRAYGATGMADTRLHLVRGRTASSARPARGPASRFVVDTPGAMATVRGTVFRVAHRDARTHAEVLEGRVHVGGGGQSVLVPAGHGSVSGADGRPQPPTPLLPAPDLSQWPERMARIPVAVSWPAVAGAQRYRVQIAPDAEFTTLLVDLHTDAPSAQFAVPGDGRFHARIRAVDADGLEGHDANRAFDVAAQPAPPFALAPEDGAAAGPRPRMRWAATGEAARYRLQLARDPAFATPLLDLDGLRRTELRVPEDLPPGDYHWRVAATGADGRDGPFGDARRFVAGPATPGPGIGEDGVAREGDGLQVSWPAGAPGQRYRFQLSRDADFARPELDTELDAHRIALPKLRAGTWYMRTALVDDDGHAHPFGPAQSVRTGCLACRIGLGAGFLLLAL